jgi:hypothetical protein
MVHAGISLAASLPEAKPPVGEQSWITFTGDKGPGKGKTVVFIAADEEYRSEETFPQFAKILAKHFGFKCIVLFGIDPKDGTICPNVTNNIPGLENLKKADLVVMLARWRDMPDDQLKYIIDYAESGKPIIGMRTSTHPFNLKGGAYLKYSWNNKGPEYEGGFGRQVFGETWVAHHGTHGKEGTRGIVATGQESNPILKGVAPGMIYGPTDVYEVRLPLPGDSTPLVLGEVTETLDPASAAVTGSKNNPKMPVAWTKTYTGTSGKKSRVFTTTMGSSLDFTYDGTRRMLINSVFWALGMESKIKADADISFVGEYRPSMFKFRTMEEWKPGVKPADPVK